MHKGLAAGGAGQGVVGGGRLDLLVDRSDELAPESEASMTVAIRPETDQDKSSIRKVNQAAFDGDDEANLVDALRDGGFVDVSLVAEKDGEIVGHILFSRVAIVTKVGTMDALSLAPMAVMPHCQRQGIGSRLVEAGLKACQSSHKIVVVLGHPEFYPRFGFSAEIARPLESPFGGGEAWMALALIPGALDGVAGRVEFSLPFMALP
ncbi:MAG: N-acetyltransferase [Planctomycetales bacterium]|nr:N-acetyltransferase [Planctomycetales bacterium]